MRTVKGVIELQRVKTPYLGTCDEAESCEFCPFTDCFAQFNYKSNKLVVPEVIKKDPKYRRSKEDIECGI